jgi:hypothetical protein
MSGQCGKSSRAQNPAPEGDRQDKGLVAQCRCHEDRSLELESITDVGLVNLVEDLPGMECHERLRQYSILQRLRNSERRMDSTGESSGHDRRV